MSTRLYPYQRNLFVPF